MNNRDLTIDIADLTGIDKVMGDTQSTLVFTGQFTYDFATGDLATEAVTRIGLDGGNYNYSLTLDGVSGRRRARDCCLRFAWKSKATS